MKMKRASKFASDFYDDNEGVIVFLVGICTVSNFVAAILFGIEVVLHPDTWYNWLSFLLCVGMFAVPGITSSLGRKQEGWRKVLRDTVFVLYGIITFSITSLSVGLAGDSPWGCGLEKLFQCEHHPGMWGAMLFGLASITGHAFGWDRIKDQQTEDGFTNLLTREQWEDQNSLRGDNRTDGGDKDFYQKYKDKTVLEKKAEYNTQVKWGFVNICVSVLLLLTCTIIAFVEKREPLGALYTVATFYQLVKLWYFTDYTNYFGCDDTGITYGKEKGFWRVVLNLVLIVWVVGANWHIVGKKINREKDLQWPLTSAILTTLVACLQHYII